MVKIKKFLRDNYISISFFAVIFAIEIYFYTCAGDESVLYTQFLENYGSLNIKTFFVYLYDKSVGDFFGWSSRVLINLFSNAMVLLPNVWKIFNALLYAFMLKNVSEIFDLKEKHEQIFVAFLIFLIPNKMYLTAGWLVTSVAYFWPVAILSYMFNVMKNRKYKDNRWHLVGLFLSTVYVANEEIICIFLLVAIYIYIWNNKDQIKIGLGMEFIVICEILWIFLCPGNTSRAATEMAVRFCDFDKLTIIKKMEMGFTATMNQTWLKFSPLIITFTLILFIFAIYKNGSILKSLWIAIPFICSCLGYFIQITANTYYISEKLYNSEGSYGSISIYNYSCLSSYIPLLFYICIGGYILIIIMNVFDYNKLGISLAAVLLWAVATRCVMGFSPTIWVSSERTFTLLYTVIFMIIIFFWKKINNKSYSMIYMFNIVMCIMTVYEVGLFFKCL